MKSAPFTADLGTPYMTASGCKLRIKVLGNGDQINPDTPIADVSVVFNSARSSQITSAVIGAATERAPADRAPSLVLKSDLPDFAFLTDALQAKAKDQLALQTERLGVPSLDRLHGCARPLGQPPSRLDRRDEL